jgi:putative FmdB family regulatory protein
LILSGITPIFRIPVIIYEEFVVPIYEYQCSACNHKFEIIQKVSDDLLTVCPKCNENALRKMVTAAAFRLKGGGWYETDFKDKQSRKNTVESDTKSDSGAEKGDSKTTADSNSDIKESKPAVSSETKPAKNPAPASPKPSAD